MGATKGSVHLSGPNGVSAFSEQPASQAPNPSWLALVVKGLAKLMVQCGSAALPQQEIQEYYNKLQNKLTPYFPIKYPLGKNYNGKLRFVDLSVEAKIKSSGFDDDTMVCRHYAIDYLHVDAHGKFVPLPDNAETIQQKMGKQTEGYYNLVRAQAPHCHLLRNHGLGAWLVQQANTFKANPVGLTQGIEGTTHCTRFFLESAGHAMALTLRRKVKMGVEQYVLTFYDPNTTTNHKRCVALKPDDFANLSLRELISEDDYAFYYRDGAQHTLAFELPNLEEEQQLFSQEKINHAITNYPVPDVRTLSRTESVDWSTLSFSLINKTLDLNIVDLSLYRYLFACKTEDQGKVLWQKSEDLNFTKAIKWNWFDVTHIEQWLELEIQGLLGAEKPDCDGFRATWSRAMQKLPKTLQEYAWNALIKKLQFTVANDCGDQAQGANILSKFLDAKGAASPERLHLFVKNLSAMLPMLETLDLPPELRLEAPLKCAEKCLLQVLNELEGNDEQNQDFALKNTETPEPASLQCGKTIQAVLNQDAILAGTLSELSKAVGAKFFYN